MSFADDVKRWEAKALAQMNKSVSNAVESLFTNVVVLTPSPANPGLFAQGHLADQWYTQAGGGFSSDISSVTNPNGANSLSRIKAILAQGIWLGKDNIVTLTNNVSYSYRVEYLGFPAGEGANGFLWSGRVGPYRMVGTAVTNFRGKYL